MNIPTYIEKYRKELTFKKYRQSSIENYVSCLSVFLDYFKERKDHEHINEMDIKTFLSRYTANNTQRVYHSAIKTFYKYVCRQPNKFKYVEYCRKSNRLPIILSVEEMERLINSASNLKHRTIICLMYSCALRVGEVISLKVKDLDFSRQVILILNAKGGKDRQVPLSPELLQIINQYLNEYKPTDFVFTGQFAPYYSERSICEFLKTYSKKAGIDKRVNPHLLRHTGSTHMIEAGLDINILQRLLGHGSVKTTAIYTHISHNYISKIPSPLRSINLQKTNTINGKDQTQR